MNEAIKKLKSMCAEAGSQKAIAKQFGITPAYLSDILNDRTHMSDRIAHNLGFRWMLIPDDPALEAYLHRFVVASEGTIVTPPAEPINPDADSHDYREG